MPRIQRPGDALRLPLLGNGLADGENVVLIERVFERRAAMAGRAERDSLRRLLRIGLLRVVGRNQLRDIDQKFARRGFSGQWRRWHGYYPYQRLTR